MLGATLQNPLYRKCPGKAAQARLRIVLRSTSPQGAVETYQWDKHEWHARL